MNRKAKDVRRGVRLNIKKPPKVETPKNVYSRKAKHKKGHAAENPWPFLMEIFSLTKPLPRHGILA